MKRVSLVLVLISCCALLSPSALFAQFSFVGPAGGDFFTVTNWQDGGGFNPASIIDGVSGLIEHDLTIGGTGSATAASLIGFGSGSLSMTSGSALTSSAKMTFSATGSFTLDGATLSLTSTGAAGQIDMNSGSVFSASGGTTMTTGDDMFFRGSTTIANSVLESTGDDIEFRDIFSTTVISDSSFTVKSGAVGAQVLIFKGDATITNSLFSGGRISLDSASEVTAADSTFNMTGDIEDVFNSITFGTLTLTGTTSVTADQVEEGVTVFLQDSSSLTLIDDDLDTDGGDWINNPTVATTQTTSVILQSMSASLTLQGGRSAPTVDDKAQIFNGIVGPSYASNSSLFIPSTWNGQDDVTIQLSSVVPEPSSLLLVSVLAGSLLASCRSRRKRS